MLGGWLTKAKGRPWIQTELPAKNKLFDKICQTQIFKNPGTHVSCKISIAMLAISIVQKKKA